MSSDVASKTASIGSVRLSKRSRSIVPSRSAFSLGNRQQQTQQEAVPFHEHHSRYYRFYYYYYHHDSCRDGWASLVEFNDVIAMRKSKTTTTMTMTMRVMRVLAPTAEENFVKSTATKKKTKKTMKKEALGMVIS